MELKNKKVLVTGGAGFIGSNVVNALIEKGANVVVIDDLSSGKKENVNAKATFYHLNITDQEFETILEKEKPEIIYHFAFMVLVPKSTENPLLDVDNIIGSLRMLKKAKEMGGVQKIVFASSGFLYGNNKNLPVKETEPIVPVAPYAIAKFTIENYLAFYRSAFNIPYVILRYAAIYGPGQVTGAMADYIRKLKSDSQADIWGDGEKTRDYVYVDDVVKANLLALDLPDDFADPVFNIGTGKETTLNELYATIAGLLGKEAKPIYHPDRPGEQMRYSLDSAKIKKALAWQPSYTLEEGLKKIIQ